MPTQDPLPYAATLPALVGLLNDQELSLSHRVLSLGAKADDLPSDEYNLVVYEIDVRARHLLRLRADAVPAGATMADADAAATPDAAQEVKNQFLAFVAPLLETADVLHRDEVYVGGSKVEIVLSRNLPPSVPAPPTGTVLQGNGWSWQAEVVGSDIVVKGAKTTAFGGAGDKGDNGQTACGFPTKGHPDLLGCALPLGGYAHTAQDHAALDGTPLPHMEFGLTSLGADRAGGAHVEVTDPKTNFKVVVPVIDLGPARKTGHALDLSVAAARLFRSNATANNFSMVLDYRVINAAAAVPPGVLAAAPVIAVAAAAPADATPPDVPAAIPAARRASNKKAT